MQCPWQKITLVGIGLLGGSLGLAIKQRGLARTVTGYVRRPASVEECRRLEVADSVGLNLLEAVTDADLVILCTPIAQMAALTEQMRSKLKTGALVTDVGSVKGSLARELDGLVAPTGAEFIGSHPMAGAEKMGVQAASSDLFEAAVCVVTPTPHSSSAMVERLLAFWKALGAIPVQLSPEKHDELVTHSSHLPHFVAAALANFVLNPNWPSNQIRLCATGFRDTTRIASGSPEMWRDIAQANSSNLNRALGQFIEELQRLRQTLGQGDFAQLLEFLATAKQRRDAWCAQNHSPSPE